MLTFCMLAAIPPVDCPPAAIPIPLSPFPPASSTLLRSFFKSSRNGCPLFSYSYELPILQPLCFDIHASDGGCTPPPKKNGHRSYTRSATALSILLKKKRPPRR